MSYGDVTHAYILAGITSTQISWANMATLVAIADSTVDSEAEASLSSSQKALASDYLTASLALENLAGDLSINNVIEIPGAIRLDVGASGTIRQNISKQLYEKYLYIISQAPSAELIERVP